VLGLSSSQEYLDHNLGWYAPAMRVIHELPDENRVLLLWEPRSLYCLPACEPDEVLDRWLAERYDRGTGNASGAGEILQSWQLPGYTHRLFHNTGADVVRREDQQHYDEADWRADELLGTSRWSGLGELTSSTG
jgi:hypothetical protein